MRWGCSGQRVPLTGFSCRVLGLRVLGLRVLRLRVLRLCGVSRGLVAQRTDGGLRVPRPGAARPRDCGYASVVAVGAIAMLVIATLGVLHVADAVSLSHAARTAADLAALAGSATAVVEGPGTACSRAAVIAETNGGVMQHCTVTGSGEVSVLVSVSSRGRWHHTALAQARAGPG